MLCLCFLMYMCDKTGMVCIAGQYYLVIGELYEAKENPVVRAMKFHDLSGEKELSLNMWPWEVRDAQQCLTAS